MMLFDTTVKEVLSERISALERHFGGDVVFYYGEINPGIAKIFRDFIEKLAVADDEAEKGGKTADAMIRRLVMFLNTPGGARKQSRRWWRSCASTMTRCILSFRTYNDLLIEYILRSQFPVFMHSRNYF